MQEWKKKVAHILLSLLVYTFLFPTAVSAWWDSSWLERKEINISEPIGIQRINEPVEKEFFFKSALNCENEIRVTMCQKEMEFPCSNEMEIPFQIVKNDNNSCTILFQTNLSANSWKLHYIYYNPQELIQRPIYPNYTIIYFKEKCPELANDPCVYIRSNAQYEISIRTIEGGAQRHQWSPRIVWNISGSNYVWAEGADGKIGKFDGHKLLYIGPIRSAYFNYGNTSEYGLNISFYTYSNYPVFEMKHEYFSISNVQSNIPAEEQFPSYFSRNKKGSFATYENDTQPYQFTDKQQSFTEDAPHVKWILHYDETAKKAIGGVMWISENRTSEVEKIYFYDYLAPAFAGASVSAVLKSNVSLPPNHKLIFYHFWIFIEGNTSTEMIESIQTWSQKILNPIKVHILGDTSFILLFLYPSHNVYLHKDFPLYVRAFYNTTSLSNLTSTHFKLFLNENQLPILNFTNFGNGSYQLLTIANTTTLGTNILKVQLTYNNLTFSNFTKIFVSNSTPFKQKIAFITDSNWKNILSLVPIKRPTIVSQEIDDLVTNFIDNYQPEQIFILGNVSGNFSNHEAYRIASFEDIPKLFFSDKKGIYAGTREKAVAASLLAALLDKPLVFDETRASPEYNFINRTKDEIEDIYLEEIKNRGKNINYLLLTDSNFSPLASIIASQPSMFRQNGFVLEADTPKVENVLEILNNTIDRLNRKGFFINNIDYYLNGAYLLILGNIPSIVKEDPVEKQKFLELINFEDPEDGTNFTTDLEYGDLNNDTYLDVAVGRLPANNKIASLMFARTLLPDSKRALVASEYLHTAWPIILLYAGGGMWQGRSVAKILEDQGYSLTRFVERRSDPVDFFYKLTDITNLKDFLDEAKDTADKISNLLGKTIGSIAYKIFLLLKVLRHAQHVLEMYLEYDWSTFGLKWQEALNFLDSIDWGNLSIRREAIRFFVNLIWPYPWNDINNKISLQQQLLNKDIIYYVGIGNKTAWILPSYVPGDNGFLDLWEFFENSYNGSNYFLPEELPPINSKLVWDNSNFAGVSMMKDAFLEKGTASLIGASAINYNQFSSEIDSRFFKHEFTIGKALVKAINDFRDDWLTWDPLNMHKPGIKAKSLREFILFGDPSLPKDPIIEPEKYISNIVCDNGICQQNVSIPIAFKLINTTNETTISVDTEDYLLELFKPITPLIEFEYYLPFETQVLQVNLTAKEINFTNITLPKLHLLQHGINYTNETISTEWYPENISRLEITRTIDNRTRIKLIHAAIKYNESSKDAIVYSEVNINLKYLTPLEFSIATRNITLGETQNVEVRVWSNVSDNSTLYLQIQNSTTTKTITCNQTIEVGLNEFVCSYKPLTTGTYLVRAILVKHDPLIVGPRESIFVVGKASIEISQPPTTSPPTIPTGFVILSAPERKETNLTLEREVLPEIKEVKKEEKIPICGNGICELRETPESCPVDCAPKLEKKEIAPTGPTGFFVIAKNLHLVLMFAMGIVITALILRIRH